LHNQFRLSSGMAFRYASGMEIIPEEAKLRLEMPFQKGDKPYGNVFKKCI
jgi:hypothetical protein